MARTALLLQASPDRWGVAPPVVGGRGGNPIAGELLGDGVQARSGDVLLEDPDHDRSGQRVRLEAVEPDALGRFGRDGVRPCIHKAVAVRGATAEESPLRGGLGGHGGPNPRADSRSLPLAHPAEQGHEEVMGLRPRVHATPNFRDPELHTVVLEQREGEGELGPVEGPLGLPDYHGLEAPIRIPEGLQQARSLGSPLPWERPRLPHVEELGDDHARRGLDEVLAPPELPGARGLRVLLILG